MLLPLPPLLLPLIRWSGHRPANWPGVAPAPPADAVAAAPADAAPADGGLLIAG